MHVKSHIASLKTAYWLLRYDISLVRKEWLSHILDGLFWPVALIAVNGYILPAMGMPADYGPFITISMLIVMASYSAWFSANEVVADLANNRAIYYDLTLPLPYWMVYIKSVLFIGLKSSIFNLVTLIIGKIILWDEFNFALTSWPKFILIYLLSSLFFSAFGVWAAVFTGSVNHFTRLEMRLIGPLLFICGYSSPWYTVYEVSPLIGNLMLLTPWIYTYEGTRSSILGPSDYINYWVCVGMTSFFLMLFIFLGLQKFKQRLDCI
jgi:hypothetical protein